MLVEDGGRALTIRERALHLTSIALFALIAVRALLVASTLAGVGAAVVLAAFAAWCAPAGPRGGLVRLALLTAAALVGQSPAPLGLEAPWRAFFAQEPGESALLVLRVGLLLALALASEVETRRRRTVLLGGACVLLLASLVFRGLLLPYGVLSLAAVGASARRGAVSLPLGEPALSVGGIAVALFSLLGPARSEPAEEEPQNPREAVAWWLARKNPHQAHYLAARWARAEAVPGEGYLGLARLDLVLGRTEAARKVLGKLEARGATEAIRAEATRLAGSLDAARRP